MVDNPGSPAIYLKLYYGSLCNSSQIPQFGHIGLPENIRYVIYSCFYTLGVLGVHGLFYHGSLGCKCVVPSLLTPALGHHVQQLSRLAKGCVCIYVHFDI